MLGKEFVKTKGHQHPKKFSELYKVLHGQAVFLLQKQTKNIINDAYFIKAKKGDKVFIPPCYAHISINPGPDDLKLGNWVSDEFTSDYSLIKKNKGAGYFLTKQGWIKNKHYKKLPKLKQEQPNKNIPQDLKRLLKAQ